MAEPAENRVGRDARQSGITEMVMSAGSVRIEELAEAFGVSVMTVHRDLDALAAQGLLRKTRGMATALASTLSESSTEYRTRLNASEKVALATVALGMIEPGQSIILDDSTTGLHLAAQLYQRQPLTVITNFQPVMDAVVTQPELALLALGGQYYPWCRAFMGSVTLGALRNLRADVFFMSTSAVTDGICFHQHHDTVLVKRAMFEAARTRIAYVDHSKFERRALHALGPLSEFDTVIVDAKTAGEHVQALRRDGANVVVAPEGTTAPDSSEA
ncbi:DNA-binding transcriptional regulator of sugar metabolism, DeoR/GlpR family [Micromonospora pallida]|uniref:DNA-binding transcriptional regulator of sugar metabolism, DeoR/GlpR family n=1 Tax=Micromonospora pallida TaxID=145854 RepID=A0A1C6RWS9_9ACTN|nr:DeoR/GlpR family DNA-binding transcription regulator [Micromonospora pallida]SCL21667.1 DNA-binding transcriptional regulator of sugar metabolism, DeoR/GlpR family [Micromonospora pallida]